jgi:RsmE family RNA methyltransferase
VNLIILFEQDFLSEKKVRLSDERFRHIKTVHRSQAGHTIKVGRLNGLIGSGVITHMTDEAVDIEIELNQKPPQKLPLTVILALPRPKMIRRIFRSITELGIEQLIVINSNKVEKSFWQSPVLTPDNVNSYLIAGLQQAKDTVLPTVTFKKLFKPFIEDELPSIVHGAQGFVAHPGIGQPCPHSFNQRCVLAIGPEGGFSDYEVNKFIEAGFEGIHLGERILRVENAITALISKLYQ